MTTLQMNQERWTIACNLAFDLVEQEADVNEFGKVFAFMRQYRKADNAEELFMSLLQRLANSDDAPIRSGKTKEYYEAIQASCQKHLSDISDADELMLILGWCRRLMYYYKVEPKRASEEQLQPSPTEKQQKSTQPPEPPKQPEKPKIEVGTRVHATILKKTGFEVTVRLQTDENEELVFHSYFPHPIGATVKLKVMKVDAEGKIKQVIP